MSSGSMPVAVREAEHRHALRDRRCPPTRARAGEPAARPLRRRPRRHALAVAMRCCRLTLAGSLAIASARAAAARRRRPVLRPQCVSTCISAADDAGRHVEALLRRAQLLIVLGAAAARRGDAVRAAERRGTCDVPSRARSSEKPKPSNSPTRGSRKTAMTRSRVHAVGDELVDQIAPAAVVRRSPRRTADQQHRRCHNRPPRPHATYNFHLSPFCVPKGSCASRNEARPSPSWRAPLRGAGGRGWVHLRSNAVDFMRPRRAGADEAAPSTGGRLLAWARRSMRASCCSRAQRFGSSGCSSMVSRSTAAALSNCPRCS